MLEGFVTRVAYKAYRSYGVSTSLQQVQYSVPFQYSFLGSYSTWVLSACSLLWHVDCLVAFFLGTRSTLCCCIKC